MKKLLALFLCFGLVGFMSIGLTGCDKGKTEAQKKAEKDKLDKEKAEKNKDKDAKDKDMKDKDAKDKDMKDKDTKVKDKDLKDKDAKDKDLKDKDAKDKDLKDKDVKDKDLKDKDAKDKDAKDKDKDTPKLVGVKIKAYDKDVEITKKGDTKITVELEEPAPTDLTIKAWAKDVDAKALTGKGMIKKGEKSGDVTIVTADAPATITEIVVDIPATDKTTASNKIKLKTKVKG